MNKITTFIKGFVGLLGIATAPLQAVVPEDFTWGQFDTSNGNRIYHRLFEPQVQPGESYPLVVFFQGIAEHGSSNTRSLEKYDGPLAFADERSQVQRPCYVLTVSFTNTSTNYGESDKRTSVYEFLDHILASSSYQIDSKRVYGIGLSNGSGMTTLMELERPDLLAAAAVGGHGFNSSGAASLVNHPIWFHNGTFDGAYRDSLPFFDALNSLEGVQRLTLYPNKGHLITLNVYNNPNVQSWLFQWKKDDTPSSAPSNLATTKTDHSVTLTWNAAVDTDSEILEYWIYRDGVRLERLTAKAHGQAAPTSYIDTKLLANTSYSYEILAVNAGGRKSAKSVAHVVTTSTDTMGANLVKVEEVFGRVRLHFDEPIDEATAENVGNYSFASGDTVSSAICYSSGMSRFIPGMRSQAVTTVNVGRTGRYVRIQLREKNFLHLAEVEVWNTTTNTNLALAGTASQSSLGTASWAQPASKGNDGNTNGVHNGANGYPCFHTLSDEEAWWEVDLGSVQHIDEIKIWNRTDGNFDRFKNFYVLVSDQPFASTRVAHVLGQLDASIVDLEVQTINLFEQYDLTISGVTDVAGNILATANSSGKLWPTRLQTIQFDANTTLVEEASKFAKGNGEFGENVLTQLTKGSSPGMTNTGSGKALNFDGVDDFVEAGEHDFDYQKGATMVAVVRVQPDGEPRTLFHSGIGRGNLNGGNIGYHNLSRDFHDISLGLENGRWKYSVSGNNTVYTSIHASEPVSGDWQTVVVRQQATAGNTAYTELFVDGVLVASGNFRIPDRIRRIRNWLGRDDQAYTSALFKAFKGDVAAFSYYNAPIPDTQLGQMVNGWANHFQLDKQKYYLRNLNHQLTGVTGVAVQPSLQESVASGVSAPLAYEWSVVAGNAANLSFSSNSVLAPQITPSVAGSYVLNLRVENASGGLLSNQYITMNAYDPADATPPTVVGHRVIRENLVEVMFSEPVSQVTAENTVNYQMDEGVVINQARYNSKTQSVVLETSVIDLRKNLTLIISGVNDLKGNTIVTTSAMALLETNVTYLETFDGVMGANWQIIDEGNQFGPSVWAISGGELRQTSNIFDGLDINIERRGTILILPGSLNQIDQYTLSATMRSSDDDGMGLVFNYKDPDNYYLFEMDSQRNFRRLLKRVGGKTTQLASSTGGYILNQDYVVQIAYKNGTITVSLDSGVLFGGSVSDSTLPSGDVGIWSWGNEGLRVKEFSVTTPEFVTSWLAPMKRLALDGSDVEHTGSFPYEKSKNSSTSYDAEVDLNFLDLKTTQESAAISGLPDFTGRSFSVSVWAKCNQGTWNTPDGLVSRRENFLFRTFSGTTRVGFLLLTWSAWHEATVDMASLGLSIQDWHCYTGVYDAANKKCKLYVNGSLVSEVNAPNALRSDYGRVFLGRGDDFQNAWHLSGGLADFRLFSHALSDTEVYRVYVGEDSDGDGIGDHWERRILAASSSDSINRLSHVGGSSDFDQDGVIDVAEYHFGTDPLQKNTDTLIKWIRVGGDQNSFDICIAAKKSRKYALFASETLGMTDPWTEIQDSGFITTDGDYTFNVPKGVFNNRFFRVEAKVE